MQVHDGISAARLGGLRSMARSTVAGILCFLALPAAAALADAAGPTDYRSTITAIDPPTPALHPSIIGGDSFLLLRVDHGVSVDVVGYQGEPYLQFLADGTVQENRASISYWSSTSRLGEAAPDDLPLDAPPKWVTVAHGGSYAWHDHRIHWMSNTKPLGKHPGDVVLQAEVPLVVDGVDVRLTVQSTWLPPPSSVPAWSGAVLGALVAAAVLRRPRLPSAMAALDVAVLATVVGLWQFFSLPSETGPSVLWFALPAVATAAGVALAMSVHRGSAVGVPSAQLLIGVDLAWWGWSRRSGLSRALLPTNAPAWLDRLTTSAALAMGALLAVIAFQRLAVLIISPQRALPPADDAATSAS